jgi:hypothetical protein
LTDTSAVTTVELSEQAQGAAGLAALIDDIWAELMREWSQHRQPRQVTISLPDWGDVTGTRSSDRQSVHILGLTIVPSSALARGMFVFTE